MYDAPLTLAAKFSWRIQNGARLPKSGADYTGPSRDLITLSSVRADTVLCKLHFGFSMGTNADDCIGQRIWSHCHSECNMRSSCLAHIFVQPGHRRVLKDKRCFRLMSTKLARKSPSKGIRYATLPDIIEKWSRKKFFGVGVTGTLGVVGVLFLSESLVDTALVAIPVASYWYIGLNDISQKQHAIRHNFPVLGHLRYLLESIGPEIRQYFVEADSDSTPFSREQRSMVYQRAKLQKDTMPFGTKRDVYIEGYEWINHSMFPVEVDEEKKRVSIGGKDCKQPYSSSRLNISAMSYGALSRNAVIALNIAARMGEFSHNTGEGGLTPHHLENGGDIIWNIGTGYFSCRTLDGTFCPEKFKDNSRLAQVKMIELKLSQGAKPGHGGILPADKITEEIASIRGIPMGEDCVSPSKHQEFAGPRGLVRFIHRLRELSGGKPIGLKFCLGQPEEFSALVGAMVEADIYPDFLTIDGGEGGTGAAPPEFSNHVGFPLLDGLYFVHNTLEGAGIRDRMKIICSGKVLSGFSIIRNIALGADVCNAARAMMFALGCIQALKCDTGKCPTGVTSQDDTLMQGLDPTLKSHRVLNYQRSSLQHAFELMGSMGISDPDSLNPSHIMRRLSGGTHAKSYETMYPPLRKGSLYTRSKSFELENPLSLTMIERSWYYGQNLLAKDKSHLSFE